MTKKTKKERNDVFSATVKCLCGTSGLTPEVIDIVLVQTL